MKARAPDWYDLSMADTPCVQQFCACTAVAFDKGATFALPTMFQNYLIGKKAPFAQPEQPSLAIWGNQDDSHAQTDKHSSRSLTASMEVVVLDHVGHFPELEDPVGFKRLIDGFIQT